MFNVLVQKNGKDIKPSFKVNTINGGTDVNDVKLKENIDKVNPVMSGTKNNIKDLKIVRIEDQKIPKTVYIDIDYIENYIIKNDLYFPD